MRERTVIRTAHALNEHHEPVIYTYFSNGDYTLEREFPDERRPKRDHE